MLCTEVPPSLILFKFDTKKNKKTRVALYVAVYVLALVTTLEAHSQYDTRQSVATYVLLTSCVAAYFVCCCLLRVLLLTSCVAAYFVCSGLCYYT